MKTGSQLDLFPYQVTVEKGATISDCGLYRYALWRIWDKTKPLVLWIMHNPSTADADKDDPTIRRIIGFTKSWGYGGFYVGNLSPYRATNPNELEKLSYKILVPAENTSAIDEMKRKCELHVLACGVPVKPLQKLPITGSDYHYLELTKEGYPRHPLYLKSNLKPISGYGNR